MRINTVLFPAIVLVLTLALSACGGLTTPTPTGPREATTPTAPAAPPGAPEQANFRLLISDEENAIGDFAHLYVTVSKVGLQQATTSESWLELEPEDDTPVDLVLLQGDNAQELQRAPVPPGQYSGVFIYVDEVEGVLKSATSTPTATTTPVKLPSDKLQINKPFEVTATSTLTFVFDITVVAAGTERSGIKYILKPVIGQSGSGQPFKEAQARVPREKGRKPAEGGLTLALEGQPQPGATSTVVVRDAKGNPVQGATVTVNGVQVGVTDADGRRTFVLPHVLEVSIKVRAGEAEGELEREEPKPPRPATTTPGSRR